MSVVLSRENASSLRQSCRQSNRESGDSRSINSKKVSFYIREEDAQRKEGEEGEEGKRRTLGRRRVVEISLLTVAVLMVWVLYSIPIVALTTAQAQAPGKVSSSTLSLIL